MSKKWMKIAAAIKVVDIESDADGTFLSNEQMDALEASLSTPAENAAELDQAKRDLQTATEANKQAVANGKKLSGELATANDTIKNLNEQITELKKKPVTGPTTPAKKKDDIQANTTTPRVGLTAEQEAYAAVNDFDFKTHHLESEDSE